MYLFSYDEFGWEYVWDKSERITINSKNPQVKIVNLPQYAGENDVILYEGYYYFTETIGYTNNVYRTPENNTVQKELIYTYDIDAFHGLNKYLKFEIRDSELWFMYHYGGAAMGSDIYCKVNKDGKVTIEHEGYLDFKKIPNGTLIIDRFVPPSGNNIKFISEGEEKQNEKSIGIPSLIYGFYAVNEGNGQGYSPNNSTTVLGDYVYVLASSYPLENDNLNRIYKINLNTNETVKITDFAVKDFKIINNKLYYVKDNNLYLYVSNVDGTDEKKLSDNIVTNHNPWYGKTDDCVYYLSEIDKELKLYRVELDKEDSLVLEEPLESVQVVNDKIICQLSAGEDYGIKIFDNVGVLKLAIANQVSNIRVDNDRILFVSALDKSIKLVK